MKKKLLFFLILISLLISFKESKALEINIWKDTGRGGITCNKLATGCDLCDFLIVLKNIIDLAFQLAFPLIIIVIIWGGIVVLTATGNEKKFAQGLVIIKGGITGLLIVLLSWSIVNIVLHILTGQPNLPWNEIKCK